jgi:hypothetical protein
LREKGKGFVGLALSLFGFPSNPSLFSFRRAGMLFEAE